MNVDMKIPERPRILILTMRRLGDVLLMTPLVHTIRERWPEGAVHALVFRGTEGMLAGNPDLDAVLTIPRHPSPAELIGVAARIWRDYDLAFCTQTGDRPIFLTWAAGRRRVGFIGEQETGAWWKRFALHRRVPVDSENHRITELLRLAGSIGLAGRPDIICPQGTSLVERPSGRYAVLHANPMFRYRRWTDEGWRSLARGFADRGLAVVATGGPDAAEREYLDAVFGAVVPPVRRLDGHLDWPQLTALLRGAAVYVGPDTSVTHLAAASGAPTVALYGPASPRRIGPWPPGGLAEPWEHAGRIQNRANVWVVQNPLACMPCEKVGCENHVDSFSQCLDELSARQVLAAVDQALASRSEPRS